MPQLQPRTFNNSSLDEGMDIRPPSKSRVFTNADLPIQPQMGPPAPIEDDFIADDFEQDSAEDDFIPDDNSTQTEQVSKRGMGLSQPETFAGGFVQSLLGGEALDVSKRALTKHFSDAVTTLPENVLHGLIGLPKLAGQALALSAGPVGEAITGRSTLDRLQGIGGEISDAARSVYDTTMQSGANPEAFGSMTGQMTLQPLLTEGLIKAAPPVIRGAGYPTELLGKGIKNLNPVSNTLPVIGAAGGGFPGGVAGYAARQILKKAESGIGSGIESVGRRMKSVGIKPEVSPYITNETLGNEVSTVKDSPTIVPPKKSLRERIREIQELPEEELTPEIQPQDFERSIITNEDYGNLGPKASNTSGYNPNAILDEPINLEKNIITNEDVPNLGNKANSRSGYTPQPEQLNMPMTEGEQLIKDYFNPANETPPIETYKAIRQETPPKVKPKMIPNRDGTFTNMDMGEVVNSRGESITEIDKKPLTRDSEFFRKNR
jgi:hypothetical protein